GSFSGFGASTPMVIGPSILALPPPPPELLVSLLPLLPLPLPPLLELLFPPLPPPPPRLRQPATVAASAAPPVARKNVRRFASPFFPSFVSEYESFPSVDFVRCPLSSVAIVVGGSRTHTI